MGVSENCQNPQLFALEQPHSDLTDLERAYSTLIGP